MTIYLTKQERKLYDRLPADLKKSWGGKVEEETGTAWETQKDLERRALHLQKTLPPRLRSVLEIMGSKGAKHGWNMITAQDFPPEVFTKALLVLGAVGITTVISIVLQSTMTDDDILVLGYLSGMRHHILMSNSLVLTQ